MSRPTLPRLALVIGASSGIGAACVQELARRGYRVAAVARRKSELDKVCAGLDGKGLVYPHDVTDFEAVPALFERIVKDLGGLGTVVYAAGAMPRIDKDTWDFEKDKAVIDVNVLGAMAWLDQAAPYFKKLGAGSIVGISSISGDRGRRGYPAYCASKAALDTFLESLRNRLSCHGVRVTTIKPGFIDTAMTRGLDGLFWLATPETAAKQIINAAESGAHTRYVLRRWGMVGFVIRNIPSVVFRRLDI
jgi:NAD(P)-dependent dehydrogenase (short-subunit alcohol dehydrogenase family)